MVLIWDSGFAPMHCNVSNQLTAHFIHTLCLFRCTRTSFWRKEGFWSPAMPAHRSHAFPSPTPWMAFHCADRGSSWRRRGGGAVRLSLYTSAIITCHSIDWGVNCVLCHLEVTWEFEWRAFQCGDVHRLLQSKIAGVEQGCCLPSHVSDIISHHANFQGVTRTQLH